VVVQFVDAGVVLDPDAELVWPARLPCEISKAIPAMKQPEGRIGERVWRCMVLKPVNEIAPEVTGLPARRNLKTGCLQSRMIFVLVGFWQMSATVRARMRLSDVIPGTPHGCRRAAEAAMRI